MVAVATDGFDRTALERFGAKRDFLIRRWLLMHEGITTFIITGEKCRGGLTAKITVDALLIGIKFSWNVWAPFVCFVCHVASKENTCADSVK